MRFHEWFHWNHFTKYLSLRNNKNHQVVGSAREAHKRALVSDYRNIYFRLNTARIAPSALGTLATAVIIGLSGAFTPLAIAALLIKMILAGAALALLETLLAKMRIFRAPEFLGTAFLLAVLGLLIHFLLGA